jgi:hypothetical protein
MGRVTISSNNLFPGPKGEKGEKGDAGGPTGPTGPIGPAGPEGPQGPQGLQGTQGNPGAQGATGIEGPAGARGATGFTGATGAAGTNGTNGSTGATGATGAAGTNGTNGATGPTGATGAAGTTDPTNVWLALNGAANVIDTMPRLNITTIPQNSVSRVYLTMFTPMFNQTISNLIMFTSNTTNPTLTLSKLGLFTVSGTTVTLVAETANDTTLMKSQNTIYTRALSSARGYPTSYSLVAGTRYAFGIIIVAASGTSGIFANTSPGNGLVAGDAPYTAGLITSQSDLPTAATTFTPTLPSYFARLS